MNDIPALVKTLGDIVPGKYSVTFKNAPQTAQFELQGISQYNSPWSADELKQFRIEMIEIALMDFDSSGLIIEKVFKQE